MSIQSLARRHVSAGHRDSSSSFDSRTVKSLNRKGDKCLDRMMPRISPARYAKDYALMNQNDLIRRNSSSRLSKDILQAAITDTEDFQQFRLSRSERKKRNNLHLGFKRKQILKPFRKFKFEGWTDNYYSNLLDWSNRNILCAASTSELFMYSMRQENPEQQRLRMKVTYTQFQQINAIKFKPTTNRIAVSFSTGTIKIYDLNKPDIVDSQHQNHYDRVTALDWDEQSNIVLTASRDRRACLLDLRERSSQLSSKFSPQSKLSQSLLPSLSKPTTFLPDFHKLQILSIRKCDNLVATGGNDNKIAIYDLRKLSKSDAVISTYNHNAAIKAMAWVRSRQMLITGGGTADKKIKFWKNNQNEAFKTVSAEAQVCSLTVSKNTDEFISCQGFSTNNVTIWDYEGEKVKEMHGDHHSRVLYSAINPSGESIATGAGDKKILIWKMFPGTKKTSPLQNSDIDIR